MASASARLGGILRLLTLLGGLGAVFAAGALLHPQFLTIGNQRDVLGQVSVNGILAVGMTLVILAGGIDLSVGSVMSLCTVVCAILLMERGATEPARRAEVMVLTGIVALALAVAGPWVWRLRAAGRRRLALILGGAAVGIAAMLVHLAGAGVGRGYSALGVLLAVPVVGGLLGLVNGVIVARTRLQPFIVTLAMMVSAVGLAKYIAGNGGQIHAIYTGDEQTRGAPAAFEELGATILTVGQERLPSGRVQDLKLLPVPGLILLGAWCAAAFLLHKLPLGRYIYAVGGNAEAARLAGVPVASVRVFVYAASGVLAGLAAVLYCAQYTQGKADAGQGKELDAIAAVVIGGTSLMGGRGNILGTLVGVLIFGYLTNVLQLRAVSSEIQDILKGVIIVGAAVVQGGGLLGGMRRLLGPRG